MLAISIMHLEGVKVPLKVIHDAREYVWDCILSDEAKGVEIEPYIRRWAMILFVHEDRRRPQAGSCNA